MQLHRDREKFEAAGVRLAVVGQGTPEHAAHFRESQHVDLPLLVDPDRRTYRAVGTKVATLGELLSPRVVAKGLRRSMTSRVHQGKMLGHPAQLGGVLVVKPDATVTYAHLAEDAGDNPPNEEVLAAAREAAAAG